MSTFLRPLLALNFIIIISVTAFANSGKIQGKVKEENGKALADVSVKATRAVTRSLESQEQGGNNLFETKTNDKGEFSLENLPAGSYAITFELTGYKTAVTRRFELTPGETFKIQKPFELRRREEPFALIRGAVLDSTGYSLPNASITIERIDGKKFKKLEKNSVDGGEFGFRVPAEKGVYRVSASADGYITASKEISIDGDEIRQVVLQLEKKP